MGMQISDLMNQYQNSLAAGSEVSTKTKGVEKLVKTVSSLTSGQVFEGTVNSIKGNQVILGLSSGQNITARLDKGVSLGVGESVFFQVKSNDGSTVSIKPISIGTANNPTLLNALESAALPINEKTLTMANAMMQQQMPIDAKNLGSMYRMVSANPNADVTTVVTMNKLGIPVTEEMATQYENYKNSEGAILKTVDDLADGFPKLFSAEGVTGEDIMSFARGFVDTVLGDGGGSFGNEKVIAPENAADAARTMAADVTASATATAAETEISVSGQESEVVSEGNGSDIAVAAKVPADIQGAGAENIEYQIMIDGDEGTVGGAIPKEAMRAPEESVTAASDREYPVGSMGRAMQEPMVREELSQLIKDLPAIKDSAPSLFSANGELSPEASASDVLKAVVNFFDAEKNLPHETISRFFTSVAFKSTVKEALSKEWTIEPDKLSDSSEIDKLYQKIAQDSERISNAAHTLTGTESEVSAAASSIHDNLEFISQVNQMFTYVQIPMRMNGENATGDLYVYSNKKKSVDDDGEVSAFLHFDLAHLGSTDISVRMKNKNVQTKFFMEDDISFELVQNNIHLLEEKLNALGYNCRIEVENDEHPVNFVEDFLKQDQKTGGNIQRYSFDVRA